MKSHVYKKYNVLSTALKTLKHVPFDMNFSDTIYIYMQKIFLRVSIVLDTNEAGVYAGAFLHCSMHHTKASKRKTQTNENIGICITIYCIRFRHPKIKISSFMNAQQRVVVYSRIDMYACIDILLEQKQECSDNFRHQTLKAHEKKLIPYKKQHVCIRRPDEEVLNIWREDCQPRRSLFTDIESYVIHRVNRIGA